MPRLLIRLWPHSLKGQVLLSLALALLLAQTIGAVLQYRVQLERRRDAEVHMLAFRFFNVDHHARDVALAAKSRAGQNGASKPAATGRAAAIDVDDKRWPGPDDRGPPADGPGGRGPPFQPLVSATFPVLSGDQRLDRTEHGLREIFAEQGQKLSDVVVVERRLADDPVSRARLAMRPVLGPDHGPTPDHVVLAAIRRQPAGNWLVARMMSPPGQPHQLLVLVVQTLILYAALVGAMALVVRRITQPLAALTGRVEEFARNRAQDGQLEPQGPEDLRRLILAHNEMERRIVALLDEKDVMLGAIGHDLKTPLSALRVRIETVEDEGERQRMADTIDDIASSLDDMLSLARVGRPSDPREATALSALVAAVVEEFEDMGEPVELATTTRVVLPLRATWLRRALRNLIGNALRYGHAARVSVARETDARGDWAVVRIDDDGPGIAEAEIAGMFAPFTRGEPSRNSETGGAGLGLTLARAIAEQHGGTLDLANRRGGDGVVAGLTATLRLPMQ